MQYKLLLLVIIGLLFTLLTVADGRGLRNEDFIKGNKRCPEGYKQVGNMCRLIVRHN